MTSPRIQKGEPVSAGEVERLKSLRALFDPASSLKVVDDYAKYLFASAAIVSTLGGAVKVTGLGELDGRGDDLFSWAIVVLGLSLACSVIALVPLGSKPNPNKVRSMQGALRRVLRFRLGWITAAGLLFATAVVLAGAAPLASQEAARARGGPLLAYAVDERGALSVTGRVAGARPFSAAVVRLAGKPASRRRVRVQRLVSTDRDGRATIELSLSRTRGMRSVVAEMRWRDEDGGELVTQTRRIRVRPAAR